MNAIKAIVKAGRVEVQVPPEWADGTEVEIHPLDQAGPAEEEGPMTPEEIARTLAAMDKVGSLDMTAEEAADLEAWAWKVKEYTIAHLDKGIEVLCRKPVCGGP